MTSDTPARSLGCARCGDCCENIPISVAYIARLTPEPGSRTAQDQAFILAHWTPLPGDADHAACDRFDPVHRRCLAYAERPPTCRDHPMYGHDGPVYAQGLHPRCSYLLDVAPADRPAGARPLIPLEVLRG